MIDGVLAALHIPHQTMSVAKWKRLAELPAEKGLVLAAARVAGGRKPHWGLVKHHGRAEALFLALLAMRRHGGR